MPQLSDAELTAMRADLGSLLPDTCVIKAYATTVDGQGGFTESWTAAGTVACRMDSTSGQRSTVADSTRSFSGFVLTVPFDTDIGETDQVVHGGYTYNVMAVDYDKSWPVVLRAQLERV